MTPSLWAVLWRSENKLNKIECILRDNRVPPIFATRREAQEWINREYGYIKDRPDLRAEPHGWKMPLPVKVTVQRSEK